MTFLPAELRDMAGAIGDAATARLAAARPGERVHVPASIPPGHWIAQAIGDDAAAKLARAVGGCAFTFPSAPDRGAKAARRACDEALAAGATVAEAARRSGLTRRAVQWRKTNKLAPAGARKANP